MTTASIVTAVSLLSLAAAPAALAQTDASDSQQDGPLAEVTINATRFELNLQDTPIAITAVSSKSSRRVR